MRQLQPRIDGAAEQLQERLDAALAVTLGSQSPVALGVCLHAYAAIARAKGFLLVAASPLTRSSYHAGDDFAKMRDARAAQLAKAR